MQNLYTAISQNTALTISYRWFAWLLAAGAMVITPPATGLNAALAIVLLALLLLLIRSYSLNVWRDRYIASLSRKPWLLLLDGGSGLLLVYLSGAGLLPFYPYALAALILPALIFGWRGALLSTMLFVAGDLLLLLAAGGLGALTVNSVLPRLLAPPLFSAVWLLVAYWQQRTQQQRTPTPAVAPKVNAPRLDGISSGGIASATALLPSRRWEEAAAPTRGDNPASLSLPHSERPLANPALAVPPEATDLRSVMHASIATEADLNTALQSLVENFNRHTNVALRLEQHGDARPLLPFQQRTLLRLAEEALINIDQHASARTALLKLSFANETVSLAIEDDGVGLLDGTYMRPGVHALRAVAYCLAELDGTLHVCENEQGGVAVRASLPLHAA